MICERCHGDFPLHKGRFCGTCMPTAMGFRVGDRVRMTREGIRRLASPRARATTGVVTSLLPKSGGEHVQVLRDGLKMAVKYHASFWEQIPSAEESPR